MTVLWCSGSYYHSGNFISTTSIIAIFDNACWRQGIVEPGCLILFEHEQGPAQVLLFELQEDWTITEVMALKLQDLLDKIILSHLGLL